MSVALQPRACVFDAYGTLLDFQAASASQQGVLGDRWAAFADMWRWKQLQYTWVRTLSGDYADFWTLTGDALDYTMAAFDLATPGLRTRLMAAYRELPPFTDAVSALRALRRHGIVTAILSNGDHAMLADAVSASGLGTELDEVFSVADARAFKTAPASYALVPARLGFAAADMLFISANGWDAYGAKRFGFRVAWLNRSGLPADRLPAEPDITVSGLDELVAYLGAG